MPNTATGVTEPAAEENVNSEAGFEAALAKKGVESEPGASPAVDTSVTSGLEVAEPGQTRTPSGQFAPKETEQVVPDTPTAQEPATPEDDPEVAALLAKYDGDPQKALKAAVSAQKLIGEQGNKLGEQAERLARLEGLVEGIKTAAPQTPAAPPLTADQVEERASSLIDTKGYADAATEAANHAFATGDERLYREVIESWQIEEPFNAMSHVGDFRAWQRENANKPAPTAPDPWVAQKKEVEAMGETITAVSQERGESWAHIAPHMEKALEGLPPAVAQLVSSQDATERLAGVRIVADRATLLAGPVAPAAEGGVPPAVARKLAGSGVATGALRPPAAAPAGSAQTKEEAISTFKQAILDTETTSVASGLTFGKQ